MSCVLELPVSLHLLLLLPVLKQNIRNKTFPSLISRRLASTLFLAFRAKCLKELPALALCFLFFVLLTPSPASAPCSSPAKTYSCPIHCTSCIGPHQAAFSGTAGMVDNSSSLLSPRGACEIPALSQFFSQLFWKLFLGLLSWLLFP